MVGDEAIYASELGSASDDSGDKSLSLALLFSLSRRLALPMGPPRTAAENFWLSCRIFSTSGDIKSLEDLCFHVGRGGLVLPGADYDLRPFQPARELLIFSTLL